MSGICQKCLRCGYEDALIGQPCDSCKDGVIERQLEFRELVDALPEPMTCGRRAETGMDDDDAPFVGCGKGRDHWDKFKKIDNRVCSYCGSLHPDDFFRLVRESANAPEDAPYADVVEIELSDKSYKMYVHQPGVRNAHEGAIKFYTQHLPRKADGTIDVTEEQNAEFRQAQRRSEIRFQHRMEKMYPARR